MSVVIFLDMAGAKYLPEDVAAGAGGSLWGAGLTVPGIEDSGQWKSGAIWSRTSRDERSRK